MAFQELVDLDCSTTIALGGRNKQTGKPNPSQVEGYFIGSKDTPSRKSKNGIAKLHIFQTKAGNVGVWGKTDLDRKMALVTAGVMVRVTQSGSVPTPNGDMYKFKVEVDKDNAIQVDLAGPSETSEDAEGTSNAYASSLSEEDDLSFEDLQDAAEEDALPPAPARAVAPKAPAQVPNEERRARVQAMLSKSKLS